MKIKKFNKKFNKKCKKNFLKPFFIHNNFKKDN